MPKLKRASFKQKSFAAEYIKSDGDGQKAILNSKYNVKDKNVAKRMASDLLDNPQVQEEINIILQKMKLDPESLAQMSRNLLSSGLNSKPSFSAAQSHLEFLYKVQGVSPVNKNMSVSLKKTFGHEEQDFTQLQNDVAILKESMDKLLTFNSKSS